MRYLTAIDASKRIGVSEKTIRLWIEKGTYGLQAHHVASNRLAIAEADVERIAKERQLYYGAKPETPSSIHTLPDVSAHDIDTLFTRIAQLEHQPEISVLTREVGKLQAKVDMQDARIAELERRIADLEAKPYPVIAENVPVPPVPIQTNENAAPISKPRIRPSQPSSTMPNDWTLCSDFFTDLNIKETTYRRWLANGISGDYFEFEEIPVSDTNPKRYRYFTPRQKEHALNLLKKHGKLPGV